MRSKLLLPEKYKWVGLAIFLPSLALGIANFFFEFQFGFLTILKSKTSGIFDDQINLTDEFALTGLILGMLFMAFAREHREDEYISRIRLESLQWAVILNYTLLLLTTWLVHGMAYLQVMVYNMLTIPLLFLLRFHFVLRKGRLVVNG